MESWISNKELVQEIAHKIDKSIIVCSSDNLFIKILSIILWIITFGKRHKNYLVEEKAITIANFILFPVKWELNKVLITLVHEGRHVFQYRRFGFGIHPVVGLPIVLTIYFFLPLPIFLAYGRLYLELDANKVCWKWRIINEQASQEWIRELAILAARQVSGPSYFWTWPKSWTERKFVEEADKLF